MSNNLPSTSLINYETEHLLLCFCTYCSLLKGKKLSLQNVFVLFLKEKRLRDLLKQLLTVDTSFELVKILLEFDPTISQSKYITKYLNNTKTIDI